MNLTEDVITIKTQAVRLITHTHNKKKKGSTNKTPKQNKPIIHKTKSLLKIIKKKTQTFTNLTKQSNFLELPNNNKTRN